jgi:hypothetical protein
LKDQFNGKSMAETKHGLCRDAIERYEEALLTASTRGLTRWVFGVLYAS